MVGWAYSPMRLTLPGALAINSGFTPYFVVYSVIKWKRLKINRKSNITLDPVAEK